MAKRKIKKAVVSKPEIKKAVKKVKKVKVEKAEAVCVGMSSFDLEKRIVALEQRIDRIVTAISHSKSIKGL